MTRYKAFGKRRAKINQIMSYDNKRKFKKERDMHTLRTNNLTRKIRQQSAVGKI